MQTPKQIRNFYNLLGATKDKELRRVWYEQLHFDEKRVEQCTKRFKIGDIVQIVDIVVQLCEDFIFKSKYIGKTFMINEIHGNYYMPYIPDTVERMTECDFIHWSWHPLELELFKPDIKMPLQSRVSHLEQEVQLLKETIAELEKKIEIIPFYPEKKNETNSNNI